MDFSTIRTVVLDLLFPPRCLYCSKNLTKTGANLFLCERCTRSIAELDAFACMFCRGRLIEPISHCHPDARPILAAMTLFHQPLMKELIHQLKFRSRHSVVEALIPHMRKYLISIKTHLNDFVVVPVPLHSKRQRRRGFNQAELIAKTASSILDLPLRTDLMIRSKATEPQTAVKEKKERQANLAGAFELLQPEAVLDQKILLVDDVATTGTTLIEATGTLKRAGAGKVIAFVLART